MLKQLPEHLQQQAARLGLQLYTPSAGLDFLFTHLWMDLTETGDLEKIIIPDSRNLAAFLNVFQSPTITTFAVNAQKRIEFLFWARPASAAENEQTMICGTWSAKTLRGKPRQALLTGTIYEFLFANYGYCFGVTWQQDLLKIHAKLGYSVAGFCPSIYGLDNVYLVLLQKDDFYNSRFYAVYSKTEKRK